MSYEIERTAPCRIGLTATVDVEEVARERERVVAGWVKAAHIDGFRKGKAPRSLVERRFAPHIREELEERLTRQVWDEMRRSEKLRPASALGVREAALQDDGGFRMKGEFDIYPSVELPPLDGFTPPAFELEPDADEIAKTMDGLRERQAAWEPVENDPAATGLLVEAEVHGEFPDGDGEPFHEERSLFQLGEGEVYPEIEAAVTGHRPGEEVRAERTIGEEGGKERQGKRTAYRIRIKSLRRKRLPDLDDAFAQSVGVATGIEALRERVREGLRDGKKQRRRDVWRGALVRHLAGEKPLPLPEQLVAEETRDEVVKFAHSLAQRGLDPERAEVDWKKLEGELRGRVEERLRAELLLDALADQLGIAVSAADVDHEIEQEARRLNTPFAELKGNLAKSGGLERVGAILRRERAADAVLGPHEKGA